MRKISLLVFILLFTFCTSDEANTINEDGMMTCDEDQKDSEGRCYGARAKLPHWAESFPRCRLHFTLKVKVHGEFGLTIPRRRHP